MHGPDDGDVFYGDQDPTNQDDFFDAWIARHGSLHVHFADEGTIDSIRGAAGFELEEIGKHREANLVFFREKKSSLARCI